MLHYSQYLNAKYELVIHTVEHIIVVPSKTTKSFMLQMQTPISKEIKIFPYFF